MKRGADYLVIGRPILDPPKGTTPLEAVRLIRGEFISTMMYKFQGVYVDFK